MKLTTILVLFLNLLCLTICAQDPKSNFIYIAVPEQDTTRSISPRYRIAGCTLPENAVTINGKTVKVYSSGAFISMVELQEGLNTCRIISRSNSGQSVEKTLFFIKVGPIETTTSDSLVIEDMMMDPSSDLWLDKDDILSVKIKGTPGCKAVFLNNIEMRELPLTETNGIAGIYTGIYRVKENDKMNELPIEFTLIDSKGNSVKKASKGRVSFKGTEFPIIALTIGERPFLNYGLGTDRLGGAKMGFLNPGIKLKITGKAGRQYKVELSKNEFAWIPDDLVILLPAGTPVPYSLAGSWNVRGDGQYDYCSIGLNEKLPYTSIQEINPNRIIVNVYGAVSNTNWITQHLTTKEIKNVYYEQASKDVFKIVIELKHKQLWGYAIDYTGNSLVIKIKAQPESLDLEDLTFALDAGHGGDNNGALGATGYKEKDVNLSTVYHLKKILEDKGAKVILTRSDDSYTNNNERLKTVFESGADILISIHSNSIGDNSDAEKIKGISTYYKYISYRPLSTAIYAEVLKTGLEPFGNIGSFNFTLNSPTEVPNVLVELAFMSNPEDEMKLMDDDFRKELAEKIVDGVVKFLEECEEE